MAKADFEVVRGTIDGQAKYCRIPIRRKLEDLIQQEGLMEINADTLLSMDPEKAAACIDAIIVDWLYWVKRAAELWVYATTGVEVRLQDGEEVGHAVD